MDAPFEPTWRSLRRHVTPQWLTDAKFGIYTHWGIYSVPARGPNATWYPYNMYREGTAQYDYHVRTYGSPSTFGYKDFIPMFTAEHFDPDEWAELFRRAGAQFAGLVGEHHDGFAMWETRNVGTCSSSVAASFAEAIAPCSGSPVISSAGHLTWRNSMGQSSGDAVARTLDAPASRFMKGASVCWSPLTKRKLKYPTPWTWPQRPETSSVDALVLPPSIVSGQIDVVPVDWRTMLE